MLNRQLGAKAEATALLVCFIFSYDFLYLSFLSPRYEYLGFLAGSHNPFEFLFACSASLISLFAMPAKLWRFSDFFMWFLYALVYVPGVVTASRMGSLPGGSYELVTLLTISLLIMAIITRTVPAPYLAVAGRLRFSSLRYLIWISVLSLLALIAVYHSIMDISGIATIYEQRARAGSFGAGRFTQYLLNWTPYAFLPILLTHGILRRRAGLLSIGLIGLFIIFMINGAKIVFAIVLIMVAIDFLFSRRLVDRPARILIIPLAPTLVILLLTVFSGGNFSEAVNFVISQVLMRAIAIQAVMLTTYADFFATHPLTYMSHVTGVSAFIHYPYSQPLGNMVGIYLVGGTGFNANSGFWATDGIASFGLIGIPIASFFVSLLLVLINMIGARTSLRFLCIALAPFCMAAANTSFFTAFITGGGLIAVILCSKLPAMSQR